MRASGLLVVLGLFAACTQPEKIVSKGEFLAWTPAFVVSALGQPLREKGPQDALYQLEYEGLTFRYQGEQTRPDHPLRALALSAVVEGPPQAGFRAVLPKGLTLGWTPHQVRALLGRPDQVKTDRVGPTSYEWHSYRAWQGDWRHYWMRYVNGVLELIRVAAVPIGLEGASPGGPTR